MAWLITGISASSILAVFAWVIMALALAVIGFSVRYLVRSPRGTKRFLRAYDAVASGYILFLYLLLTLKVITVGEPAALLARIGFVTLLGLFIAEIISDKT